MKNNMYFTDTPNYSNLHSKPDNFTYTRNKVTNTAKDNKIKVY
jgi:hypothetical protein